MARLTDTISGPIVTFRTPGKQDIRSLKVHFKPVQEGSGDPSPENVREISGWTGCNVYQSSVDTNSPTTIPIDWSSAGTIYGGYVDLVTGEVWETYHKITLDGVTTNCKVNRDYSDSTHIIGGIVYLTPTGVADGQSSTNLLCENMPILAPNEALPVNYPYIRTISAGMQYLRISVGAMADHSDLDTSEKRIAFVNEYLIEHPTAVVYPLAMPTLLTALTPTQLKTLIGTNNIWSNANGDVDVEYDFAESREMIEARKRVAGYRPWKMMWHNSFDKYQIWPSQTGSVFTVMDDGKWLEAVSNGQNSNATRVYMNDRFLYNDIKDKLCRITYTIECDQSVTFDGTNTFGHITLALLSTKATPSTTSAHAERVSKVDIVKQDTFIGHHSVEFVPSELFADLNKADYFGWNLGFRSSIDGITIRITQLDFEIKK